MNFNNKVKYILGCIDKYYYLYKNMTPTMMCVLLIDIKNVVCV